MGNGCGRKGETEMSAKSCVTVFAVAVMVSVLGLDPAPAFGEEGTDAGGGIPAELKGFRGMMSGKLVEKGQASIVFKVGKIMRVWKGNEAENPKAAVGKTLTLNLNKVSDHHRERIMKNFRGLKRGDRIEVEAFDLGSDTLCIKEWLKKAGDEDKERE